MPRLEESFIHLGRSGTACAEPPFTGMEWYAAYAARHADDGAEGRLVSHYRFTEDWPMWEMHPYGAEVVICSEGRMTLYQEHPDGTRSQVALAPGDYAINPPGIWHTADVDEPVAAIFITSGLGTEHRPR
ncbi:MAG: cupin [Sphingomonas sp.]|nr:cupin [Sphingomonas sp.]MAX00296.1 cupin [Sphingomonas sp.]